MSIFKRVRDITVASINEILDKVEDPVAMLNQYLRDMESEIQKAEVAVARQDALEKKWKGLVEEMEDRAKKRDRQARLAVDVGDDRVARQALADKEYCQVKIGEYQAQYETAKEQKRSLSEQLQELKDKYYELRSKKYALVARANVASAKKQMNVAISSIDTDSAARGFARIEERVMMMETDAAASERMKSHYSGDWPDEKRAWSDQVEEELAKLKAARQTAADKAENEGTSSLS